MLICATHCTPAEKNEKMIISFGIFGSVKVNIMFEIRDD